MSAILRHLFTIGWHRILIILLAIWLIIFGFTAFPIFSSSYTASVDQKTSDRLARALADLEALRKQNIELQEIFKDLSAKYYKMHVKVFY